MMTLTMMTLAPEIAMDGFGSEGVTTAPSTAPDDMSSVTTEVGLFALMPAVVSPTNTSRPNATVGWNIEDHVVKLYTPCRQPPLCSLPTALIGTANESGDANIGVLLILVHQELFVV